MRALWQSLYDGLLQSVETITFKKGFDLVRQSSPLLQRFGDDYALLDYLHAPGGDLDDKDRILASLVAEARGSGRSGEVATVLLWLALWPGLDALYRRLSRHFVEAPEDLVSEISDRFMVVIHRLDCSRVHRVAATILQNTERLIRYGLRSEWQRSACTDPLPDDEEELFRLAFARQHDRGETLFGLPRAMDLETATEMLRAVLVSLIGPDAEIVVAVAVRGELQSDTAARLSIGPCAARKRYQRAVARLRTHLEGGMTSHSTR